MRQLVPPGALLGQRLDRSPAGFAMLVAIDLFAEVPTRSF
jgi:hypothetical protein